jgi:hypothetical protein
MTEPVETTDAEGRAAFAYLIKDMEITNPTLSECGRFTVEPEYYRLTEDQAARLDLLNRVMRSDT